MLIVKLILFVIAFAMYSIFVLCIGARVEYEVRKVNPIATVPVEFGYFLFGISGTLAVACFVLAML